jgi:hypothetical protein
MPKQEILPPVRLTPVVQTVQPVVRPEPDNVWSTARSLTVTTGDPISSALTRWRAERHTRTIKALTIWTDAEAAYFESLNKQVQSYTKLRRSAYELAELPEAYAAEKAVRRVMRANHLRQAQHTYEVDEFQRLTEVTRKETELTDARQQLTAQRKYGESTYELAWKKKHVEMLELELDAVERRELLRQHRISLAAPEETEEERLERKIEEEVDVLFDKR